MKIASLCMVMLAMLLKVAKRYGKVAKQECQPKYNNNNNLRLRVPRVPRKIESAEKMAFKSAKSAKPMARMPSNEEKLLIGRRRQNSRMLPGKAHRPLDRQSRAFLKRNDRTVKICDVLNESEKC